MGSRGSASGRVIRRVDFPGVRAIGSLNVPEIEREFGRLNTREVILTDERARHIQERHPEDYALFEEHGASVVARPDIVMRDSKNPGTVLMVGRVKDTNLNAVVRLSIAGMDGADSRNTVITFFRIRTKNLTKLIDKNKVLYRRAEP